MTISKYVGKTLSEEKPIAGKKTNNLRRSISVHEKRGGGEVHVKKLGRIMLAGGAISLVCGCVAPEVTYQQPVGSSMTNAKLLMRGSVDYSEAYGVYLFSDPEGCRGRQRVGLGTTGVDPQATTIPASGLATVDVVFARNNRIYCQVRWSFYPKPGKTYLIQSQFLRSGCKALLMNASDPDNIVLEATARRRESRGNWCIPISETRPIGGEQKTEEGDGVLSLPVPRANAASNAAAPRLHKNASDDDLKGLIGGGK